MNKYFSLYRFLFVIVTFVSVIMFVSCEKSLQEESNVNDKVKVSFRIAGVNSERNMSKLGATNSSAIVEGGGGSSNLANKTISKNLSLEVGSSVEGIESPFENNGEVASGGFNKIASVTTLPSNIKYRIVLIDSNNDIVFNQQATSGEIVSFDLIATEQYSWYAYSYGDDQDIPDPGSGEQVMTPIDKDFLYVKGSSFIPQVSHQPVNIIFEHQVALVSIELDYDRLYAQIPTNSSNSSSVSDNFKWSFSAEPDFLYRGMFSLRSGEVSGYESYTVDLNDILEDHPSAKNVKLAKMYTTGPSAGFTGSQSFSVTVDELKVRYPNTPSADPAVDLLTTWTSPVQVFNFALGASESVKGKHLAAKFKLKYTFPQLNILHVTNVANYGYAAESTGSQRSSFNMLNSTLNFGTNVNSIFRTSGFTHQTVNTAGALKNALYLDGGGSSPDIVILGVGYVLTSDDVTGLVEYLNRGGVLFLMSGSITNTDVNLLSHQDFLRALFQVPTIEAKASSYIGGGVYKLKNYDDRILNGAFGNVRNEYWGKHNGPNNNSDSKTIVLENLPSANVIEYSGSNPVNSNDNISTGATMLKHKQRHFFWVGDAGFIAYFSGYGSASQDAYPTRYPFATSDLAATRHTPEPRYFGSNQGGFFRNNFLVYNSTIFANFMSWAIVNATFFGINHGGLGSGPYYEF